MVEGGGEGGRGGTEGVRGLCEKERGAGGRKGGWREKRLICTY